ncbi:MAG: hypothetical protein ACMUJM_24325 [bacterium]
MNLHIGKSFNAYGMPHISFQELKSPFYRYWQSFPNIITVNGVAAFFTTEGIGCNTNLRKKDSGFLPHSNLTHISLFH